jgi:hypothetical protein
LTGAGEDATGAERVAVEDGMGRQALESPIEPRVHLGRKVANGLGDAAATAIAGRRLLGRQPGNGAVEVSPRLIHVQDQLVGHCSFPPHQSDWRANDITS